MEVGFGPLMSPWSSQALRGEISNQLAQDRSATEVDVGLGGLMRL